MYTKVNNKSHTTKLQDTAFMFEQPEKKKKILKEKENTSAMDIHIFKN